MEYQYYRVGRVPITITNYEKTMVRVSQIIAGGGKGYICVTNMRTATLANNDEKYLNVVENSLMNIPDGTPIVWCGKWWGLKNVERVCGPVLFNKMLADKKYNFKHFLLGDTNDTLFAVKEKAIEDLDTIITGTYSPPFKSLEEYDLNKLAKMINESGANVIWTSLRAPKQDYLGQMLVPLLNNGVVMIGVGAAFRAFLGELNVKDSGFIQKIGLSGWTMLRKNTSVWKELKWYMKHIYILTSYFFTIKYRKLKGKKCYE